jgi:hypothetical protein
VKLDEEDTNKIDAAVQERRDALRTKKGDIEETGNGENTGK